MSNLEPSAHRTIAIQGIKGSFHHEAANRVFGPDCLMLECMTFRQLVEAVVDGRVESGLMAVENSIVGSILPNFTYIRNAPVHIAGETCLQITQHLMALPGQSICDLKEVHSHPMALMQTEAFFDKHPHLHLKVSADTAHSARDIARNNRLGAGAVGSRSAAALYGLKILASGIETYRENHTRFWILRCKPPTIGPGVPVKASVAFVAPHTPGSLLQVLQPLADAGVNLSMLQSVPLAGSKWEYVFHADLLCASHAEAERVLADMQKRVSNWRSLGVYPAHPELMPHSRAHGLAGNHAANFRNP